MAIYYKPQSPIQSGEDFIYPLTTSDQVILSDGSRLEKNGLITSGDSDKLGGIAASSYALKTDTAPDSSKLDGRTLAEIMLALYPVGAVYISANSTSPAGLFGGTWVQLKDRFLIGAGNSYSVNGTGGASSVNITPSGNNSGTALNIYQMPSHSHGFVLNIQHSDGATTSGEAMTTKLQVGGRARYNSTTYSTGDGQAHTHTFVGTTQAVSTMPPYLAVYMWKRVS